MRRYRRYRGVRFAEDERVKKAKYLVQGLLTDMDYVQKAALESGKAYFEAKSLIANGNYEKAIETVSKAQNKLGFVRDYVQTKQLARNSNELIRTLDELA